MIRSLDIEHLQHVLDGPQPAVLHVHNPPDDRQLGIREAASLLSPALTETLNTLRGDLDRLYSLLNSPPAPILGVIGDLNGGKSSLIASFLSRAGMERIPRGLRDQEGTHRFVLWCPLSWRENPVIWKSIEQRLESVFSSTLEYLSEEQSTAHLQYNGQGNTADLKIPLIAFDPKLDDLQLCLLDSPDVETGGPGISTEERKQIVTRAARLTSAILFVVSRERFRAEKLTQLATALHAETGNREFFLFINKLNPREDTVEELYHEPSVQQFLRNLELGPENLFVAYDFDHKQAEAYLPRRAAAELELPDGVPCFFQVSLSGPNRGEEIPVTRLATARLQALDKVDLCEKEKQETLQTIRHTLPAFRQQFRETLEEHSQHLLEIRNDCFRFLRRHMSTEDQLNIPFTPDLLARLAESIQRTVPFYLKPTIWTNNQWNHTRKLFSNVKQTLFSRVSGIPTAPLQQIRNATRSRSNIPSKENPLTAEQIAREFHQQHFVPEDTDLILLTQAWQEILNSLDRISSRIDEAKLDQISRNIWKEVPFYKKLGIAALPPVVVLSGLVSLLVGFADGGTGILLSASLGELLASAGLLAAGGTGANLAGGKYHQWLLEGFALDAYEQMLASCCDVFGLPRPEAPVREEFTNTGKVRFRVADAPASPLVLKLTRYVAAREIPKGWKSLFTTLNLSS